MMKIVIEVLPHTGEERTTYHKFNSYPVTIGRGLKNDLIIDDPHVDAKHLQIECDHGVWSVIDRDSINGFAINDKTIHFEKYVIESGDVLKIGKTELGVFSEFYAVEETVKIEENHPILNWIEAPFSAWITFILTMCLIQFWAYLEMWAEERGMAAASVAAITVGVITAWSVVWSVASRLIRNKSNFKKHVTVISLYLLALVCFWYVQAYTRFLTNGNMFSDIIQYGINFVLLSYLVYGSLSFTTRMARSKNAWSSMLFSGGVLCGIILLTWISQKEFNPQPMYSFSMEPYFSNFAAIDSRTEFMQDNGKLFSSKTLDVKK